MVKKYAKRRTKRKTRKTYRKKGSRTYTTVNKSLSVIAPRYITKLKYVEYDQPLTSTVGATVDYIYSLNSLFDPNVSGTGHQPLGFDQLNILYNRYRVFRANYRITFQPTSSSATFMVYPSNSNVTLSSSNPSTIMEQSRTISRPSKVDAPVIFTGTVNLPKLNGVTSSQYKTDDRFQSLMSGSPSELLELHIMASASASATATYRYTVQMTYYAEFYDPLDLAQS